MQEVAQRRSSCRVGQSILGQPPNEQANQAAQNHPGYAYQGTEENHRIDEFNNLMSDIRQTSIEEQQRLSEQDSAYDSRLSNQQYRDYLKMTVQEVETTKAISKAKEVNKGPFGQVQKDDTLLWAIGRLGGLRPFDVENPILESISVWVHEKGNKQVYRWLNDRTGYTMDDMGRIVEAYGYYDKIGEEYGENSLIEAI